MPQSSARPSLQFQLAFGALGAMALVVVVITALALWVLRADLSRSAGDVQATLADSLSRELDADVAERRHALALTAATLGPLGLSDAAVLRQHFENRPLVQTLFDAMLVVAPDGRVVYGNPGFKGVVGDSVADRHYFQDVMRKGQPVFSHPVAGKVGGEPGLVFATPIRNTDGATVGVLCGLFYLDRHNFLTALSSVKVGKGGYVGIVTRGERPVILMQPRQDHLLDPAPPKEMDPDLARAVADGVEGTVEGRDAEGLDALFSYRVLKNAPLVLTTAYPSAEAFAQVRRAERLMVGLGAVLMLAAGVGLWLLVKHRLAPLERLRTAMEVARSRAEPTDVETGGEARELHDLAEAYNALMAHIRAARTDSRRSSERLKMIADNLPVMAAYLDDTETLQFVNTTCCEWFDLDRATAVGRRLADVLPPVIHAQWASPLREALWGRRTEFDLFSNVSEPPRHLHIVLLPDVRADGRVAGAYVLAADWAALQAANARRLRRDERDTAAA